MGSAKRGVAKAMGSVQNGQRGFFFCVINVSKSIVLVLYSLRLTTFFPFFFDWKGYQRVSKHVAINQDWRCRPFYHPGFSAKESLSL